MSVILKTNTYARSIKLSTISLKNNKKPVKQFIKKHPHHSLLYGIGGTLLTGIIVMGGLIWNSSSHLYADQATRAQQASAYISSVSRALAGTGSASAAAKSESSRQSANTTTTNSSSAPTTPATTTTPATAAPARVATPPHTPPSSDPQGTASNSTLRGLNLYVDPSRAGLPSPLNNSPVAIWFGDWDADIRAAASSVVTSAANSGSVATLVAYNIPGRDCGSYSAGGAGGSDAYKSWIRTFAAGIGDRKAIVILEPDAVAQVSCIKDSSLQAERYALLQDAINVLTTTTRASVYLDAGNSNWIDATDMASRLQRAGVAQASGFSLNVSNFETTANNTSYGNTISSKISGKHFIIDTSRNGNGPGDTWCNPAGRALGEMPSLNTTGNVDAYLWVKVPGESDGTCNGGPSAGTYWGSYAQQLINNRHY